MLFKAEIMFHFFFLINIPFIYLPNMQGFTAFFYLCTFVSSSFVFLTACVMCFAQQRDLTRRREEKDDCMVIEAVTE